MRIAILGADGMLGHQLAASLRNRFDIFGTVRGGANHYGDVAEFLPEKTHYGINARTSALEQFLDETQPEAVINAIGIVKQRREASDPIESIEVNSLLPHRLAAACAAIHCRLIHVSTDCVYSGKSGMYSEKEPPDVDDLYGRTKALGEVTESGALTLRTSIIGLELTRRTSLIEWFLAQRGTIRGYTRAIYSGFTTLEFSRIIEHVLTSHPGQSGLYNVASDPIDKCTLLRMLNDRLGHRVEIVPDDSFTCDRSLNGSRFRKDFSYNPPSWETMLDELADQIRERNE